MAAGQSAAAVAVRFQPAADPVVAALSGASALQLDDWRPAVLTQTTPPVAVLQYQPVTAPLARLLLAPRALDLLCAGS